MLSRYRIGFVGAGQMAEALIGGLLQAGLVQADRIIATDPSADRRRIVQTRHGVTTSPDNEQAAQYCNLVCLCVEPQILDEIFQQLAGFLTTDKLIVSVAAGYPLRRMTAWIGGLPRLVRAMPNTPSSIGEGVTAVCFADHLSPEDQRVAIQFFESIGKVSIVEERLMDAVTGLSGSGPAYVFTMIEALADGGVLAGLPRSVAQILAAQTVAGAARMLLEQGQHPARLKDLVASPGGTTMAGLCRLEEGRMRAALIDAVEAATVRCHELGLTEAGHI
jgi:pyrroline-5-carboxylate reductase